MSVQMLPQIKQIHGMEGVSASTSPCVHYAIFLSFLPARRYASAGNSDRNVSVCPSRAGIDHLVAPTPNFITNF